MRITVYTENEEIGDDNSFGLNVKEPITDDEIREHVDCFTDSWNSVQCTDGRELIYPN